MDKFLTIIILFLCNFTIVLVNTINVIPRVLDDISTHKNLQQFAQLLRDNENARRILRHRELTILAPTDEAFSKFNGRIDENLLLYHMIPIALFIDGLVDHAEQNKPLLSVNDKLPNLWLSIDSDHIDRNDHNKLKMFVNDGELLTNDSNHQSRTRDDDYGKLQVMHKVNKVLSPMILPLNNELSTSPTAYDLLAQTSSWPLVHYVFRNYYRRVITSNSVFYYKDFNTRNFSTFIIPADAFRSSFSDLDITQDVIKCAIVPFVRFVHSNHKTHHTNTQKQRTLSRNCEVMFHYETDLKQPPEIKVYDTINHNVQTLKILYANIPLKNGVAHVVDQMPGLWRPRLTSIFPLRSLWEYINNNYSLMIQTLVMQNLTFVELQNIRNDHPKNFTLFVVMDSGWEVFVKNNDKTINDLVSNRHFETFMMRHITEDIYDMKRLLDVSSMSLKNQSLHLGLGEDKIAVRFVKGGEEEEEVFVLWGTKRIKVVKNDVKCTNGIIHFIDAPFIFNSEINGYSLVKFWKGVVNILTY